MTTPGEDVIVKMSEVGKLVGNTLGETYTGLTQL